MAGWTVRKALDESIRRLTDKNVTEPDYSALYLMAASLELPWERGIRDLDGRSDGTLQSTKLTTEQASDLEAKLRRREDHEPIQYVLGQWDFLDYTIAIRKPLLCPRPETEELVLKVVEETTESPVHILDIGCGTGVIGISLAELLPDATVEAIDVEPVAIETSMENAQRVLKDQTGGIDKYPDCYKATLVSASEYTPEFPFDVVVSNPPYIPRSDMEGLSDDVTQHESDVALCGGTDGMDVIYTIIERLPEWCNTDAVCWMEVDPSHPKLIEEFLLSTGSGGGKKNKKSMFSGRSVRFESSHKDMFGKDRFVKLRVV
jgi:release factor glutamine methyltransferase